MKFITIMSVSVLLLSFGCYFSFANQADLLCNRVNEIKTLPFKGEHVDDEIYNGLIHMGKDAAQCLAKQIVDTTIMPDPRKAPPYEGITVGDVALFVIVDITNQNFEDMLPDEITNEYKKEGIYAYFKYVERSENRKIMQKNAQKAIEKMNSTTTD